MKKITQEDVGKAWDNARKARDAWEAREEAQDKARQKAWKKAHDAWELEKKFKEQEKELTEVKE